MKIKKIAVIGAGTMGSGITQVVAQSGYKVTITDIKEEVVQKAIKTIEKYLQRSVEKKKLTPKDKDAALARINPARDLEGVIGVDVVIEAVPEEMSLKKEIFKKLDATTPSSTILATNTSSLSITKIASFTSRPEKVIGMHFFNPAPLMKAVEVIPGKATSKDTVDTIKELAKSLGKIPIEANDYPGFIVNRLLPLFMNEAMYLLMEGNNKEDIDAAARLALNHPMGPLELADLCGLDVTLHTMESLYEGYGDPKYRPCPLLRKMVEAGYLGRKSGKGFYDYPREDT